MEQTKGIERVIFAHTHKQVMDGTKTQTRRIKKPRVKVGRTYALQPGRGKKQIGRIRVTHLYQEQLCNISPMDVQAEGFDSRLAFAQTWDTINKKRGTTWGDNPYVWVLCFELVSWVDPVAGECLVNPSETNPLLFVDLDWPGA